MRKRNALNPASEIRRELGYITESETANLLGLQLMTFRNRQTAGTSPPFYKLGREKLFLREEVDAWIRRRRHAA